MDKLIAGKNMLMDKTSKLLARTLDFRTARQSVIAGNLANIDTPGFIPREIAFEKELQQAFDKKSIKLSKTEPGHFSTGQMVMDKSFDPNKLVKEYGNPNELNIDKEMAKLAQNNLLYEASAKLLSKKFELLKTVITSRR